MLLYFQLARERAESGASPASTYAAESANTTGISPAIPPSPKTSSPALADNATPHVLPSIISKPSGENSTAGIGTTPQAVLSPPPPAAAFMDTSATVYDNYLFNLTTLHCIADNWVVFMPHVLTQEKAPPNLLMFQF